ncbi:MAG: enoyl-CoA hydratase/isomerase family protein, partial [Clostridia bacterium]
LLNRLVGMAQAKRLALLGERLTGKEAEKIGLVYKAVPATELETEAGKLIATLKRIPPHAYAKTKEGLHHNAGQSLDTALAWEACEQPKLILHPAFQSLVQAKLSKSSS